MKKIRIILILMLIFAYKLQAQELKPGNNETSATSATKLPSFFSSGMVLQQQSETFIWGTDEPGKVVKLVASWHFSVSTKTDEQGKWKVKIQTPKAGGPYTINIKGSSKIDLEDILIGEVWFCSGQSNMEMKLNGFPNQPIENSKESIAGSANSSIRMFTTKRNASLVPQSEVTGNWAEASIATTGNFSAVAYYYGKKLQETLKVPVGLIVSAWGGSRIEAWMDPQTTTGFPTIINPDKLPAKDLNRTPTLLYNGMLHPFIGYTIKGCIWYQGEENVKDPVPYATYLPAMIKSWRKNWGIGNFPFYYVQIAPYDYGADNSAYLREAQFKTLFNTENTGMAVTLDVGNCKVIHPGKKQKIGDRLAYWAISKTYKIDGVEASGPVYKAITEKDSTKITIAFTNTAMGLVDKAQEEGEFQIAGIDKMFYPAMIKINKDKTITLWNEKVKNPQAVRYGFTNCARGTLFNSAGLPASSFRTDEW